MDGGIMIFNNVQWAFFFGGFITLLVFIITNKIMGSKYEIQKEIKTN